MPIDPRLSAQEVFEIHKAAVTRDFVAKPRLGELPGDCYRCSLSGNDELHA